MPGGCRLGGPIAGHVPGGGALAYWRLDESGGTDTAVDSAGVLPANHLTAATGVPTVEAGKIGNARHFNASYMSGLASAACVTATHGSHSLGFWIKTNDFSGAGITGIKGVLQLAAAADPNVYSSSVQWHAGKELGYGSSDMGNNAGPVFFAGFENVWVHCVITYNVSLLQVTTYRNGVSLGSLGLGVSTVNPISPTWFLGRGQWFAGFNYGDFALDDVWFESGVYSPSQVLADYNRWRPA